MHEQLLHSHSLSNLIITAKLVFEGRASHRI